MIPSRPLTLSRTAILLSVLSLSCSLWVACKPESNASNTPISNDKPGAASTSVAATPQVLPPASPAPAATEPSPITPNNPNAAVVAEAPTTTLAQDTTPAREIELRGEPTSLHVKRLVVTNKVENRDPAEGTALNAEGGIIAFVELENSGSAEQAVVITFERSQAPDSVGHVKLTIPAKKERWRTWARTHNINGPGTWDAVVSSADGVELARTSFEVTG